MIRHHNVSRFLAIIILIAVLSACAATETTRSAGETIDDATITSSVKANLLQDEALRALQIDVDTFRGVVQLNGFVDTNDDARRAAEIAMNTPGVASVQNNLQVKPPRG